MLDDRPVAPDHRDERKDAAWEDGHSLGAGDALPGRHVLSQLQRETRRSGRTASPLSIVLLRFESQKSNEFNIVGELLKLLQRTMRETDAVCSIRMDRIAVLLPGTNQRGAMVLAQRFAARAGNLPVSAIAVAYPDQLFEELITENRETPDTAPLPAEDLPEQDEPGYRLKRGLDIVGAIAALVLLSPLMLITAIAVAVTSPGPVIFGQSRFGKGYAPFVFYKFRSMRHDADDRIHREYVANLIKGNLEQINQGSAAKPVYKMTSDPRVTSIGRFIRDTHLDELPQLFNVLKGDMSLVGPRPPIPYEVADYKTWHLRRILEIRPGITGLWQVEGHNATSFDDMVRIDLRYVRNCSLVLDLRILSRTVKIVSACIANHGISSRRSRVTGAPGARVHTDTERTGTRAV